jgi:mannose-6-phosphate isomerase-like protein (cupin superfamily)
MPAGKLRESKTRFIVAPQTIEKGLTLMILRRHFLYLLLLTSASAIGVYAQPATKPAEQRAPSTATRPITVLTGQSLDDLQRKVEANKVQELIGGEGMQLRVAIQHDKDKPPAAAELHDNSDDVYYVLAGTATLTLGGKLDAPKETEPGEWRAPKIVGGQQYEISKGDLIIVPRGTPHQRSTAGKDFTMILIKVYAEPLRPPPAKKP